MEIEIGFSSSERARLEHALSGSGQDVDATAELVARAGAREGLALATGQVVPSTLAEARAFRIYTLMQEGIELTDLETVVAVIFKVPAATARRMVSSAVARYAVDLTEAITTSIEGVLDGATWDADKMRWEVRMATAFLRERILGAADPLPVPDPTKSGGSVFRFADETYQAVRESFGLADRPPPT